MATLGSLIISLEANTAKFEAAMSKAEYAAKKASDNIIGALKVVGVAMAGMFSLSSLDAAFSRITTMESNLLKVANRLNTTTETLSSFSVMARKTGMDSDSFNMALTRMEKGLSAAAKGAETATGKFDEEGEEILKVASTYAELGLKAEIVAKLPLEQQLLAMAAAMKSNIAPSDQVRIAMELFGRGGAGMVTILKEGPEAMQKWIDRATELGLITTDMAKRASEAKSAAGDLSLAWEGFARTLVDAVAPAIATVLNYLTDLMAHRQKIMAELAQPMMAAHGGALELDPEAVKAAPSTAYTSALTTPSRTKPTVAGKGGGGDMGLDRMQSLIDTLQKDLSRLTEGSLAEIDAWAVKIVRDIEKVGKKGADTEQALALVAQVEAGKKKKVTEDYEGFVAKESGDSYKAIEAEANAWLTKYKGFAGAEEQIASIKAGKIWDLDVANSEKRLGMQKSVLDALAQESPFLSQQLMFKAKILPLEIELNRLAMERMIFENKIGRAQADELRGLQALANQAKKYNLEREEWRSQGMGGGIRVAAVDMKQQADIWAADQTAALMKSMPEQVSSSMATFFVDTLKGKQTDFMAMGEAMATSVIQKLLEGVMVQIIPALAEGIGGIMGGIGGGGGGGIFGSILGVVGGIFGFHEGGIITAHGGWPLASDEKLIKAQTGERVLSRSQNKAYEAGGATFHYAPVVNAIDAQGVEKVLEKHGKAMLRAINKHIGPRGQKLGDGRY